MSHDPARHEIALAALNRCGLLCGVECAAVREMLRQAEFAACLDLAETLHVHVKVADTAALRLAALAAAGAEVDHARPGYVKLRFACGLNAIFSHIPVAEEDLAPDTAPRRLPRLDHLGIDVRDEGATARRAFDSLPAAARERRWPHATQGGPGRAVKCCHSEVGAKHWLYVPVPALGVLPVEVAFGKLRHGAGMSGCDLRPANPELGRAPTACCTPARVEMPRAARATP